MHPASHCMDSIQMQLGGCDCNGPLRMCIFPGMSSGSRFTPFSIDDHAFPAVIQAGHDLFARKDLRQIQFVGQDILATFGKSANHTAVISRKPGEPLQYTCSCGYRYGGACEHVVAAMVAVNSHQSVQVGLDFDSPPQEPDQSPSEALPAAPVEDVASRPIPRLYLTEHNGFFLVELRFAYADSSDTTVEFTRRDRGHDRLVTCSDGLARRFLRSKARELLQAGSLEEHKLRPYNSTHHTPAIDPREWIQSELPRLAKSGFEIFGQEQLRSCMLRDTKPTLTVRMKSEGDFFFCDMEAMFDGIRASMHEVFEAVIAGNRFVRLSDGSTGVIPEQWVQKISELLAVYESKKTELPLRFNRAKLPAVRELLDAMATRCVADQESIHFETALQRFDSVQVHKVPEDFQGSLRPYQQAGFDWFHFLQEFGLGGCLADDMGLGKTVQTLALLLGQRAKETRPRTSLLVVPTSLMFNWEREAKKFAPVLRIMRYHGPERKKYSWVEMAFADVVLTTYGTVQRDLGKIKDFVFNYVILDEAQAIKNPLSQNSQTIRKLRAKRRLALSGTPIENGLSELWSLFSFLNPGMLGTYRHFAETFLRPIQTDPASPRAGTLRKMINPCILRRTKQQVAKDLPPKTETILYSTMEPAQQALYDITRDMIRVQLKASIDTKGLDHTRIEVIQGLLRLRQICCHPTLADKNFSGKSGKFVQLDEQLDDLIADGHKVLIFSQFVSALELLAKSLHRKQIRLELLTGKTTNRQKVVDSFQENEDIPVMLISLKAGGTGLNLTAADYVIHLDPWWNPAAENQASDRAYRIGQTKPVFVYKLITRNSVEERVLQMQQSKKEIFDAVIATESSVFKQLNKDDIMELFG